MPADLRQNKIMVHFGGKAPHLGDIAAEAAVMDGVAFPFRAAAAYGYGRPLQTMNVR
jgi:hypothetical protein